MSAYNQFLINSNNSYYLHSMKLQEKQNDFLQKLNLFNKTTGEITKMSYDFNYHQKNNSLWYNFVSTHINNKNLDKVAVFVTMTLDSTFHKFKNVLIKKNNKKIKSKKFVENKKFVTENNINCGYRKLNDSFRSLIKDFKIDRVYKSLKYFKVIEPHSDFTPHLHAIIYLDKSYLDSFEAHFLNNLKIYNLGKIFDFQIIDNCICATSYIMKYVSKSLMENDLTKAFVIDGWKKINKIRMVSHSAIPVPRYLFDKVSKNIDLSFGQEKFDIIQNLLDNVNFNINYYKFDSDISYKTRSNKIDDYKFNVDIKIVEKSNNNYFNYNLNFDLSKVISVYSLSDFIDNLVLENFDFQKLMRYEYDDFSHDTYLDFVSLDFDYVSHFKYFNYKDFKELYSNFINSELIDSIKIFKIEDFKIYENNKIIYDKLNFVLI